MGRSRQCCYSGGTDLMDGHTFFFSPRNKCDFSETMDAVIAILDETFLLFFSRPCSFCNQGKPLKNLLRNFEPPVCYSPPPSHWGIIPAQERCLTGLDVHSQSKRTLSLESPNQRQPFCPAPSRTLLPRCFPTVSTSTTISVSRQRPAPASNTTLRKSLRY